MRILSTERRNFLTQQVSPRSVSLLHGMADSRCNSNFFARFFHGVLELHVIWIEVLNSCHLLSIVELRLFNNPMLLFFLLRAFRHVRLNYWQ